MKAKVILFLGVLSLVGCHRLYYNNTGDHSYRSVQERLDFSSRYFELPKDCEDACFSIIESCDGLLRPYIVLHREWNYEGAFKVSPQAKTPLPSGLTAIPFDESDRGWMTELVRHENPPWELTGTPKVYLGRHGVKWFVFESSGIICQKYQKK